HAHMMEYWDSTPRLAFLSAEPASGKSRALEITELLVPIPLATINSTPAYMFRKIGSEDGPPTILFDEIDAIFGPKAKEHEDLRAILNAGHRKGATAGRCIIRGKTVETEELPAYPAVALARLGWLPDTILTRQIVVRMKRRAASEKIEAFRRRTHAREGYRVRGLIEAWANAQPQQIAWDQVEQQMPPEIRDRTADVWEPLFAIADLVGG